MVTYCCAYGCKEYRRKGGSVITFHSFPQDEIRRKEWLIAVRRANFKVTNCTKICSKHFEEKCFDRGKFGGTWLKRDAKPTIFEFPSCAKPKETSPKSLNKEASASTDDSTPEPQNMTSPLAEDVVNEMHSISQDECLNSSQNNMKVNYTTLNDTDANMKEICRLILPKEECYILLKKRDAQPSTSLASDYTEGRQKKLRYLGDFTDDDMDSPEKARKALFVAKRESLKLKKKFQSMTKKKKRLDKRLGNLSKRVSELEREILQRKVFERKILKSNSACDVFKDEKQKTWDLIQVHDNVAVIIYNSTRQLLLFMKQFSPGMTIELCSGTVEEDQSLAERAREEVLEECGYDVPLSAVQEVTSYGSGVGVTGSMQTLFYVEVTDSMKVSEGSGNAYEGELNEVIAMNLSEARSLIYDKIVFRPTSLLFALMWFFDHIAPSELKQKL